MTDRELLELAATAAGVAVHHWSHVDCPDCPDAVPVLTDGINTEIVVWNPLLDDGDALRLAVKLSFCQTQWFAHNPPDVMIDCAANLAVQGGVKSADGGAGLDF